jgi:hypothetical protein
LVDGMLGCLHPYQVAILVDAHLTRVTEGVRV